MVVLMRDSGLRIGEVLGLRREILHFLPDSRPSGVPWWARISMSVTARTQTARSRKFGLPRTVPASDAAGLRRLRLRTI